MVLVGFRRPGPSGPCPEVIDLKEWSMVMDTPSGLWNWFFSKVVERTPVEDVLIMNGLSCFLYKFFSSTLLKRQFQGLPVGDHDRALILEVYGLWAWPKWSWPSETNSNHSLLLSFTSFVPTTLLKNHSQWLQGVTLIMLYSLRSMASGLAPDGHGHWKPPETIHYYYCLKLL